MDELLFKADPLNINAGEVNTVSHIVLHGSIVMVTLSSAIPQVRSSLAETSFLSYLCCAVV